MTGKDVPLLWCLIQQQEDLRDIDSHKISQFLNLIAKHLEVSYGPSIYSWALYWEARYADLARKKQDLEFNRQPEPDASHVS